MGMFTTIVHTHPCRDCGKPFEDGLQIKTSVEEEQYTLARFNLGEVIWPGEAGIVPGLVWGYRSTRCNSCYDRRKTRMLADGVHWNDATSNIEEASLLIDSAKRSVAVVDGFLRCDACIP